MLISAPLLILYLSLVLYLSLRLLIAQLTPPTSLLWSFWFLFSGKSMCFFPSLISMVYSLAFSLFIKAPWTLAFLIVGFRFFFLFCFLVLEDFSEFCPAPQYLFLWLIFSVSPLSFPVLTLSHLVSVHPCALHLIPSLLLLEGSRDRVSGSLQKEMAEVWVSKRGWWITIGQVV